MKKCSIFALSFCIINCSNNVSFSAHIESFYNPSYTRVANIFYQNVKFRHVWYDLCRERERDEQIYFLKYILRFLMGIPQIFRKILYGCYLFACSTAVGCMSHRHWLHIPLLSVACRTAIGCVSHHHWLHIPPPSVAYPTAIGCMSHHHWLHIPPPSVAYPTAIGCMSHHHWLYIPPPFPTTSIAFI